ncbi:MAG: hypothetical protein KBS91_00620 [Firmicutes bacterium]|nr:hypothetical protein [Candidatus Caballimonas caccae]
MEELKNEEMEVLDGAVAGEENKTEISLGKFKDVNALLNAYNSLESEFTKRCQKIKELEGKVDKVENSTPTTGENPKPNAEGISEEEKMNILKDYLKGIMGKESNMVFLGEDGVSVKTKAEKPKSIDEAGSLAKSIFNN